MGVTNKSAGPFSATGRSPAGLPSVAPDTQTNIKLYQSFFEGEGPPNDSDSPRITPEQEQVVREAVDKLAAELFQRLKSLTDQQGKDTSAFEWKCREELGLYIRDSLFAMLDAVDAADAQHPTGGPSSPYL